MISQKNVLLLLLCSGISSVFAEESTVVNIDSSATNIPLAYINADYEILSNNERIGIIHSSRAYSSDQGKVSIVVKDELSIEVKSFWSNYSLKSIEEMQFDGRYLTGYHGDHVENKKHTSISALLSDGKINFKIKGADKAEFSISKTDYDATSENAPWVFLLSDKSDLSMKVLDFDDFEIKNIRYKKMGKTTIELAGETIESYHVRFSSNEKTGEQWLTEDDTGIWLLKEQGKDKDGDYSIKLVGYRVE